MPSAWASPQAWLLLGKGSDVPELETLSRFGDGRFYRPVPRCTDRSRPRTRHRWRAGGACRGYAHARAAQGGAAGRSCSAARGRAVPGRHLDPRDRIRPPRDWLPVTFLGVPDRPARVTEAPAPSVRRDDPRKVDTVLPRFLPGTAVLACCSLSASEQPRSDLEVERRDCLGSMRRRTPAQSISFGVKRRSRRLSRALSRAPRRHRSRMRPGC